MTESQRTSLVDFFTCLMETPQYWYCMSEIPDLGGSLADLLGLTPDELLSLLKELRWAKECPKRGVVMQQQAIKNWINENMLADFLELSRFYLNGKEIDFLRVGDTAFACQSPIKKRRKQEESPQKKDDKDEQEDNDERQPPQIDNLDELQKKLRSAVKSILETSTSFVQDKPEPAEQEETTNMSTVDPQQHPEEVSVSEEELEQLITELKTTLLPCILNTDLLEAERFWKRPTSCGALENAVLELASRIQRRNIEKVSTILGTTRLDTPSKDDRFPVLSQHNIPTNDTRVQGSVLHELHKLNKMITHSSTMYVDQGDNKSTALVAIPKSKNYRRLQRNDHHHKWFGDVIKAIEGLFPADALEDHEDAVDQAVINLVKLIGCRWPNSFHDALQEMSISADVPKIDEALTFAIQSEANLTYFQMRIIRRYLRLTIGSSVFAPEKRLKQLLGSNFIEPEIGCYMNGNERIEWSCKDPDAILRHYLTMMTTQYSDFAPDHVDASVSIDHGKSFSRATLVIVCRMKDVTTGQWKETVDSYALASAKCRKDNYTILENTYAPKINEGLLRLRDAGCVSVFKGGNSSTYSVLGASSENPMEDQLIRTVPVELWMSGDLLFFAIALGREGSASHWCQYCDKSSADWKVDGHTPGTPWTIANIVEHLEKLKTGQLNKKKAQERRGATECLPLFTAIAVDHFVDPVLHEQIGIVNKVYENFLLEAQAACETYTIEYIAAETEWNKALCEFEESRDTLKEFQCMHCPYEEYLKEQLKQPDRTISEENIRGFQSELDFLELDRKGLKRAKEKCKVARDQKQAALAEEAKNDENSKARGQPVRARLEEIAKQHGSKRGVTHGGDMQGPGCRNMMRHREEMFASFREYLLGLPGDQKHFPDEEIKEMCDLHERMLGHLDGLFTILRQRRHHVSEQDYDTAAKHVTCILALARGQLNLSITPKFHCVEDHAVEHQRLHKGFGDLGEDEGERAHQVEAKNERRVFAVVSVRSKERAKSQFEEMEKNPQVKQGKENLRKQSKRKLTSKSKRTGHDERQALLKEQRDERRSNLINSFHQHVSSTSYSSFYEQRKRSSAAHGQGG
jgi:hypothetical protein